MGASVLQKNGTFKWDPAASPVSVPKTSSGTPLNSTGTTTVNNASTGIIGLNGQPMDLAAYNAARQKEAADWAAKQNAAENASVETQEAADTMAENKDRNAAINQLAASQGFRTGGGGQIGRGSFQRRQTGVSANAVGQLNAANAKALAEARKKELAAKQAADPTRTTAPQLGYAQAIAPAATAANTLAVQGLQTAQSMYGSALRIG